jgi:hypothetical protein
MKSSSYPSAGMAELADAADSKSADLRVLGVQLPLPAPTFKPARDTASDAFAVAQYGMAGSSTKSLVTAL